MDEIKKAEQQEQPAQQASQEISQEELEKVSGGRSDGGGATVGRANFDVFSPPPPPPPR